MEGPAPAVAGPMLDHAYTGSQQDGSMVGALLVGQRIAICSVTSETVAF